MLNELELFISESGANSAMVISNNGDVSVSINVENENSIAAMSDAILSMCNKFLSDTENGISQQTFIKTNSNLVIFNKINENSTLVVFSKIDLNVGLLLHNTEEICTKLNKL